MVKQQRALPKFDEKEPDEFFQLFEKVALNLKWPKEQWPSLVQGALISPYGDIVKNYNLTISKGFWRPFGPEPNTYTLVLFPRFLSHSSHSCPISTTHHFTLFYPCQLAKGQRDRVWPTLWTKSGPQG